MRKKISPWVIGILLSTIFFVLLAAYTPFRYFGSDDTPILRAFMGYEGGTPANFHLYIHTAFAWLLYALSLLAPGIAWFSILQLFLLWFSCVVIVKSMAQCAVNHRLPIWTGAALGFLFILAYAALFVCRVSYTTTGALLGASATIQLLNLDYQKGTARQIFRGISLSVCLLLCCYLLRQISVLPPLAFWFISLLFITFTYFWNPLLKASPSRSLKPLIAGALACVLSLGLLTGIRFVEIKVRNMNDFLAWQQARIEVFDYTSFVEDTTPETLSEIGWSQAEFALISRWFFMDQNITTEAFNTLYAAQPAENATFPNRLNTLGATLASFFTDELQHLSFFLLFPLIMLFCFVLRRPRKEKNPWIWLTSIVYVLFTFALLGYLASMGRLPLRAVVSVTLPATGALLMLSLHACGQRTKETAPRTLRLFAAAFLLLISFSVFQTAQSLYSPPKTDPFEESVTATISADLDAFALENPDVLIIYDSSLIWDSRLFPDISEGIPTNVMFWGGWPARSPSWHQQLAAFGIDGAAFTARDFLGENIVVASAVYEPMPSLLEYISEGCSGDIEWDFYGEYGYIYFFQFDEY